MERDHLKFVGSFALSTSAVLSDPGLELKDADYTIGSIFPGDWSLFEDTTRAQVEDVAVYALLDRSADVSALVWHHEMNSVSDCAVFGLFDLPHFHDASLVPADQKWSFEGQPAAPEHAWYSLVCETAIGIRYSAVIPYGCIVKWDGLIRVHFARVNGEVNGIRFDLVRTLGRERM